LTTTGLVPRGEPDPAFVTDATSAVFKGIPAAVDEDAIVEAVTAALAGLAPTGEQRLDVPTIVHRVLLNIVDCIRKAAAARGVPCRRLFHKEEDKSDSEACVKPGFIATAPYEHEPDPRSSNHDFFLEAKAVQTIRKSRAGLMRKGVAQAVRDSVMRFKAVGPELRHGLAAVSNGIDITFLRINFAPDDPHQYKVLLTTKGLEVRNGDGLRYFVRLLCQPVLARAAYGWPAGHHLFGDALQFNRLLGSGGFADVCCVTRRKEGSGEPYGPELALKKCKRAEDAGMERRPFCASWRVCRGCPRWWTT
jgi:hypothetical protein